MWDSGDFDNRPKHLFGIKKLGVLLVGVAIAGMIALVGLVFGIDLEDIGAALNSWEHGYPPEDVCGILIIAENFREHEPLHTCVRHDPNNPGNFQLYHPAVPGYEDNNMTFFAGVTEVPAVEPRGEGQTY